MIHETGKNPEGIPKQVVERKSKRNFLKYILKRTSQEI